MSINKSMRPLHQNLPLARLVDFYAVGIACLALASVFASKTCAATIDAPSIETATGGFVAELGGPVEIDQRLKMSVIPQYQLLRSQAPLNCYIRLQWDGPGLMEGRLLFDLYGGERYMGSWRSPELAITNQVYSFPIMLPPSPLNSDKEAYTIQAVFDAGDRKIGFDLRLIAAEPRWSRRYIMGVVTPKAVNRISGFTSEGEAPQVADIFQLADFHRERALGSEFNVNIAVIEPADVSIEPLRLTGLDLLLISSEAFPDLRPNQLEAITRWVHAGGRVCAIATSPVPESLRIAWQGLLTERVNAPIVRFDDAGQTIPIEPGAERLRINPGLGKVLCLIEPATVSDPRWTADVGWIFGILESQKQAIAETGYWKTPDAGLRLDENSERIRPFGPRGETTSTLMMPLLPNEVRGVSFWQVLLLLGTCLVLIGPVDYYVLGRLRMRKWTWLFLPAIALGATWVTVRMSWASLGEQGYVRTLSVADLGTDSQVDRTTRFELEFSPIEETQVVDLSGVYRIDYQMSNLGRDVSAEMNERWQTGLARAETRTGIPIRYEGGIPGAYDVWQPMRQWSPRLFRDTTFGRDERVDDSGLSQIDWHALELLDWTTKEGRNAIASLIHAVNPDARVRIRIGLHNSDVAAADQPASEEPAISKLEEKRFQSLFDTIAGATSQLPEGLDGKPIGLFGMVYERAPTCGPDLEDLAMLDPQDNRQAVLLVGIPGADTVIFRKRLTLKK